MIRSLTTLVYGVGLAALVLAASLIAAIWVIGMSVKAALFGEPKATLAMKLFERVMSRPTDITGITPDSGIFKGQKDAD